MDRPIVGDAKLIYDGAEHGIVGYRIEPQRNYQGMRLGLGVMTGNSLDLFNAQRATKVTLQPTSGKASFDITVTDASMTSMHASFMASGTVFDL